MSSAGSVSRWLPPLQQGNLTAVQQLWERYFLALMKLARGVLGKGVACALDEEDVALSAFDSFCRNAADGRFPQLSDRDDLWRLLTVITVRKAKRVRRDENRLKRGGPEKLTGDDDALLHEACTQEPTPDLAAQFAEEYERLLRLLDDDQLRQVALLRMENYTVEEVAAKMGCAPRSVKRKMQLIRTLWEQEKPT